MILQANMRQDLYADIIWGEIVMENEKILGRILFIVVLLIVLLFIVFIVASRLTYFYYLDNRPSSQENTTWVSEDGKISLHIDENGIGRVFFEQDDSVIECCFVSDESRCAHIYALDAKDRIDLYPEEHYEVWNYTTVRKDTFSITVEKTTFLKVGKKITFNKATTG